MVSVCIVSTKIQVSLSPKNCHVRPLDRRQIAFGSLFGLDLSMCMQSFIKIIALFKSYDQFLYFGIFTSAKPRPNRMKNDIWLDLWLEIINIKCMQHFVYIFRTVQEIGPVLLLSEFRPHQSLDQWQMAFDNPLCKILLISIWTQNFITIFHSLPKIGPFSYFQNLELSKASTVDKCHFATPL